MVTILKHHCIVLLNDNHMVVRLMQSIDDGNPKAFLLGRLDDKNQKMVENNL